MGTARPELDFVNARFDEVTVAAIDAQGCAKVHQKIRGPFGKPEVERPNVLVSLAGPALKLLKQARGLLPGGQCKVFYAGSMASPNERAGSNHIAPAAGALRQIPVTNEDSRTPEPNAEP